MVIMTYATETMVKNRLKIIGETRNTEIAAALEWADQMCDALIVGAGGDGSVSSPSDMLKNAAADFAAAYILRTDNPDTATLYDNSARTLMRGYVAGNVTTSGLGRTGRSGIRDE